jgi:Domain of unknown function (DUF6647)
MQTVLTLIVSWLSANFALPTSHDLPQITLVAVDTMQVEHLKAAEQRQPANVSSSADASGSQVEAFYDDATQTIYLPRTWTGNTPGELSVLVHEMVHHLQNVAGLKYACPQQREKLAYLAQDKWLNQFRLNLIDEFELNKMTVLVRTNCFY